MPVFASPGGLGNQTHLCRQISADASALVVDEIQGYPARSRIDAHAADFPLHDGNRAENIVVGTIVACRIDGAYADGKPVAIEHLFGGEHPRLTVTKTLLTLLAGLQVSFQI